MLFVNGSSNHFRKILYHRIVVYVSINVSISFQIMWKSKEIFKPIVKQSKDFTDVPAVCPSTLSMYRRK